VYILRFGIVDQVADAGAVYFDADKIILWLVDRLLQQGVAVAKTDFDNNFIIITE